MYEFPMRYVSVEIGKAIAIAFSIGSEAKKLWPTCGGAVFADDPPNREKTPPSHPTRPPPLRTWGIIDPPTWGGHRGLLVGDCGPTGRPSNLPCAGAL